MHDYVYLYVKFHIFRVKPNREKIIREFRHNIYVSPWFILSGRVVISVGEIKAQTIYNNKERM